jgi:hypothetical protein
MTLTSPLDSYAPAVQVWLSEGKTKTDIVRKLRQQFDVETSTRSIDRLIDRHELDVPDRPTADRPGLQLDGEIATITTEPLASPGEISSVIEEYGLALDDWMVERVILNRWDANAGEGETLPLKQFKIFLKRRYSMSFVMPAQDVTINLPKPVEPDHTERYLAVVVGDEQEPYSDPVLKGLFLQWLQYNEPEVGVHLGDLMDLPTVSRHKDNPEWAAPVQECINEGYLTLKARREASPETYWYMLPGNHDERIRNELLMRAERMYGIRPADTDEEALHVLDLRNLLHLEALEIEYVVPNGSYTHAHVKLSPELSVRHGWLTGDRAAAQTLDRLGHSVIVGHSHRQSVTQKTIYDSDDRPKTLFGVEAGAMCQIEDGLGYTVNPNWQQGFVTASIFPDGSFSIELATYSNGTLRWRDQIYTEE